MVRVKNDLLIIYYMHCSSPIGEIKTVNKCQKPRAFRPLFHMSKQREKYRFPQFPQFSQPTSLDFKDFYDLPIMKKLN